MLPRRRRLPARLSARLSVRPAVAACLAVACLAAQAQAPAPSAPIPIPIEHFSQNERFGGAQLSPDGRHLAVRVKSQEGRVRLVALELPSLKPTVVASFADGDIGHFVWVNEHRLAFGWNDREHGQGDLRMGPGLFAASVDGSGYRELLTRSTKPVNGQRSNPALPWNTFLMQSVGDQRGGGVYVTQRKFDDSGATLYAALLRLNTLTGRVTATAMPDYDSQGCLVDHAGAPRIAIAVKNGRASITPTRTPATAATRR